MPNILRTALVQFSSGPDVAENLEQITPLIEAAADGGARLIITPENTCHIRVPMIDKLQSAKPEAENITIPHFAMLAERLNVYILVGSISVRISPDRLANRAYLFGPDGTVRATYDKIHLFDADLPNGERYRESDLFQHGDTVVAADIDGVKLGITICYDLRFPQLYRALAKAGVQVIAAPSAYVMATGEAHWHTLLRARAIENGVYMLAPAQAGTHQGGRKTYGHSLAVDPWGGIVAERTENTPGILMVDLDLKAVENARAALPCLSHDREFILQEV